MRSVNYKTLGMALHVIADACMEADRQQSEGKPITACGLSNEELEELCEVIPTLLTTDKECVVGEVKAIKAQAEETLTKVDEMKQTLTKCNSLLEDLDTAYKEKQATENRFRKIEDKMDRLLDMMERRLS